MANPGFAVLYNSNPTQQMSKRALDMVVISDVHLGTYGCRAKELLKYLKSIDPQVIVLNGDIIDIWQLLTGRCLVCWSWHIFLS